MKHADVLMSRLHDLAKEYTGGATIYALADSAIYRDLIDLLDMEAPLHRILFKDSFLQEYASAAPYLIALDGSDDLSLRLLEQGYGTTWLSFVISALEIDPLARILRERINPYSEVHKQEVILRWYDPRNMEKYFQMLTEEEAERFLNEIIGAVAYVDTEEKGWLNLFAVPTKERVRLVEEAKQ